MKNNIIALVLALFAWQSLSMAQNVKGKSEKEPCSNSIELMGGGTCGFFSVSGESGKATGAATGGNFNYRYTHFFKNGYGFFAQIGSQGYSAGEQGYFGAVNKADGEKYLYRFNSSDYSMNYYAALVLGGVYSFDFVRYSIRPRVGIGIAERDPLYLSYERRSREGSSGPQYFTYEGVSRKAPKVDYLLDSYSENVSTTTPVLDMSVQFVLSPRSLVSLFAEVGMMADLSRMQVEKTTVGSKKNYSPSNWVEATTFFGSKDSWVRDDSSSVTEYTPLLPVPVFRFSIGVAVNFGKFNR